MDITGIAPPKIDWDITNLSEAWKKFQQHMDLIFTCPLADKKEPMLCKHLLLWIGDTGRDVFNTWEISAEDAEKLQTFYGRFKSYVQPKLNAVFACYKFNSIIQNSDISEKFVTHLKLHVMDCNYNDPEEMMRDRIVFWASSLKVRERLINEGEKLTLQKAIQISQSYEYSQEQLQFMSPPAEVHPVSKQWQNPKFPSGDNRYKGRTPQS